MSLLDLLEPVVAIINKVIPDKTAAAAAEASLRAQAAAGQLQEDLANLQAVTTAQSDINKVEAASLNWFVAGARPFVMWICAIGLAIELIIAPFFTWIAALVGHPMPFPIIDSNQLMGLLFPLLGLGAYRTVEKIKGVSGVHT
jgi:hypothetical protein